MAPYLVGMRDKLADRNLIRGLAVAGLLIAATAVSRADAEAPEAAEPKIEAPRDGAPLREPPGAQPPQAQHPPQQSPPSAEAAPATAEQRAKLLDELYARLAASPSPEDAELVVQSIERLWHHSGSATADLLVERAIAAGQANNQDLAMKLLDAAVLLQPDFVDAWNRRAFLYYLKNDYNRALGDLRRVLALDPNHFRALEGLAQILRTIGEKKAALDAYRKLLAVHPQASGAKQAVDELTLEIEGQGI
jgi:tetratricopeptide (TPR) repeat protein